MGTPNVTFVPASIAELWPFVDRVFLVQSNNSVVAGRI